MPTDTILIIDKDLTVSSTARQTIEETGLFHVDSAATGMEALAVSMTRDIHLVLMESEPADMSAKSLIEQLRARRPDLPIIVMHTPQPTGGIPIEDLKAQKFLLKPLHFLDLPGIVADFLGNSEGVISTDPFAEEPEQAAVLPDAQSQNTSRSSGRKSPREDLVNLVHESQAFSCLLIEDGEVKTVVGQLSTSQTQHVFPFLKEVARSTDVVLPLVKFYPLADRDLGMTMFIHAIAPNIRVVSLFDAQIEFSLARAQAEKIADTFSNLVVPSKPFEGAMTGPAIPDQPAGPDLIDVSTTDRL